MTIPSLCRSLLCLALPALFIAQPILRAQDPAPPPAKRTALPSELVIKGGTFELNGERVKATLRRVVDVICLRYSRANITLVGADDILIEDVTLRLQPRLNENEARERPLHGMLVALRAASRNRFRIDSFGDADFVLSGEREHSTRRAEVFRIAPLLGVRGVNPGLQAEIDRLEAEIAAASKRFTNTHPTMVELTAKRDALLKQQARAAEPPKGSDKMLSEIQDVVRVTLERLRPGETPPEFQFHQGTGLLVVIGSEEAIDVTRKVVAALQ